jgi:REP element-mobilizing transposase RayT
MRKVESWLDAGHGNCWLARRDIANMMLNTLLHFHGKRYDMGACCVMPNHVHAVFRPLPGHEMEEVMKSWKGFSSHEINKMLSMQGTVWIQESYDTIVRDARHLARVVQYIGNNPAKAGLPSDQWYRWENPEWARLGWGFREPGR